MTDELAVATERMNAVLSAAEETFAARFAVRASVPMSGGIDLVFCKEGRQWCLRIERDGTGVPIATTSRKTRVEALTLLAPLYHALVDETDLRVSEIGVACAAAEALLALITGQNTDT